MADKVEITLLIPAYNEESRLEATVRAHHDYWMNQFYGSNVPVEKPSFPPVEILIVVNGSRDATGAIARRLEQELPLVRAWETPEKLGKGGAVFQGFRLAKGEIVAFCDADNSTIPEQMAIVVQAVRDGHGAAIGSRWCLGSRQVIRQPLVRRIASRVFNLIVRLLFGFPFTDTQCGAKAFRRDALIPLLSSNLSSGWAFDVELIWRLRQARTDVIEVPIEWRDESGSRLRMHRDGPQMILELLRIRFSRK